MALKRRQAFSQSLSQSWSSLLKGKQRVLSPVPGLWSGGGGEDTTRQPAGDLGPGRVEWVLLLSPQPRCFLPRWSRFPDFPSPLKMSELYTCTPFSTPIQQDKAKTIILTPELKHIGTVVQALFFFFFAFCKTILWVQLFIKIILELPAS